jgi:hypothetical protein
MPADGARIVIGLTAVILALNGERPGALSVQDGPEALAALPFGPFDPEAHRTFELAMRAFVRAQTGFEIGYVEQLYTFGDRGREAPRPHLADRSPARVVSVGYLALTAEPAAAPGGAWADWYRIFPWEDWRGGRPSALETSISPRLRAWADDIEGQGRRAARWTRAKLAFGLDGAAWNEERVLDRYELLYEADLAPEAEQDRKRAAGEAPPPLAARELGPGLGEPMASDHRRILATAIGRLRAKIKYRPVIFELLPDAFTLFALQSATEAILGLKLHKQNFRRALAASGLVEGIGRMETETGGRPAELHRFRRAILSERPTLGVAAPKLKEG